jgi:hypothetical protein
VTTRGTLRRGVVGLLAFLACFSCAGADAWAGTEVASYTSPACPTAVPVWHIGYRLFWTSSAGQTTSQSVQPEVLERAERFVDDVSQDSACGVRATVDVFDEGAAQWPASQESASLPADDLQFLGSGPYDWVFYRFPANGEAYCANTDGGTPSIGGPPGASRFPVNPQGSLACGEDDSTEPSPVLMEHEWLHAVVGFYNPRLGWPTPDVHGACSHGYECSEINEAYFADLMQGRVLENGAPKGIQPDEWSLQGTPADPLIHSAELGIGVDGLDFHVEFPADLGAPVHVTVTGATGSAILDTTITRPGTRFSLPGPGSWTICLSSPGSEHYYPGENCIDERVRAAAIAAIAKKKLRTQVRRHGSRYRIVAEGLPDGSTAVLLVDRAGKTHRRRGRRHGAREVFTVNAGSPGTWRIQLQVRLPDGQIVTDRSHILRGTPRSHRRHPLPLPPS